MQKQFEFFKKFFNKYFFLALAGYFIFAFAFAYLAKILSSIRALVMLDIRMRQTITNIRLAPLDGILKTFTDISGTEITVILTVVSAIILWLLRFRIYSLGILLSVGIAEIITFAIKNTIDRHRPPEEMMLVFETSPSFPSGHTIAATTFFGFLIYLSYKNIQNSCSRTLFIILLSLLILLAGFTRIYLGVHWPSDVIGGYIIGGIWLLAIIWFIEKNKSALEN